jgi:hypothetical protein
LVAFALTCIRYFAFPPPLTVQIESAAALSVPADGAFSVNGENIATSSLRQRLADYATATLGRFRHGRVIVVLPSNDASGCCADALNVIGDTTFDAGFEIIRVVRSDLDD